MREISQAPFAETRADTRERMSDIAISCRVRLARNLKNERFPDWASEQDREQVFNRVSDALTHTKEQLPLQALDAFTPIQLELLCESHLVSKDLLERQTGGGIAYAESYPVCVMVNEEDHLRIQGFSTGLDMEGAWRLADQFDSQLELHLDYAWSPHWGYLTACPSNVGTGLRASVMLHLLGLRLLGEIDPVVRALERMRLLVRGISGEGSDAAGHIYQVSNMDTLGMAEDQIVKRVTRIGAEIVRQEQNARIRLLQESPLIIQDCLARSLSVLQNARLLSTAEAFEFLSAIRLGAGLGLITRLKVQDVDNLILLVQPGHMQYGRKTPLQHDERDALRAEFIRDRMASIRLKF